MFAEHQKVIQEYAQSEPDALAHVMTFVFATVQQQLHTVPMIMDSIEEYSASSGFLWGWKADAYVYAQDNKEQIYSTAMDLYHGHADPIICERELIGYFATLPGLGLVKGGFVVQLAFGLGGCIDRHNIAMHGVNPNVVRASLFKNAKTAKTRNRRLDDYQELLVKGGGCAKLWDNWCDYVAAKFPNIYENSEAVSRLHLEALRLI